MLKTNKILNIPLPILYSEGNQLGIFKNGIMVDCFDPVTKIDMDSDHIYIHGWLGNVYPISLDSFDDIRVIDAQEIN